MLNRFVAVFFVSASFVSVAFVASAVSCGQGTQHQTSGPGSIKAICILQPLGKSTVRGAVWFSQLGNHLDVRAKVIGLAPGKHGFNIHEFGDISSADGHTMGGHFNPRGTQHGGPGVQAHHAGDLGNLIANAQGVAEFRMHSHGLSLTGPDSILGRSMVVHVGEDDLKSQPSGGSGARIAGGVIGRSAPNQN